MHLKKMEKILHLELYQPLVAPNHPFLKDFPLKIIHFWWIPPGSVLRSSSVFPANCEVFHRLNLDLNRWIQTKLPKSTLNIQHTHTTWTYTTHTHIYIYIDIYVYQNNSNCQKILSVLKCINNSMVPAFLAVRISLL